MPEIVAEYLDGVAFRVSHRGHSIVMDQPVDNHGADAGLTPPELFASSLAGCVGYYIANYCRQAGISTSGLKVGCDWAMAESPKRIGSINIAIDLPGLPEKRRRAIERVAAACLIHATLHQPPEVSLNLDTDLGDESV